MKAAVLEQQDNISNVPLKIREVLEPHPINNEVRLKVAACGVCRTDLHIIEGDLTQPKLPLILGHQVVGVVDEPGPTATKFKLGDRVGVTWLYRACGMCKFCKKGLENLCDSAQFTGYTTNGGYAEYLVVPENFVVPVPQIFSDIQAAPLLCAGVIGYRSLRHCQVTAGDTLGLIGFGASAHLVIQVAKYLGIRVFVFTRNGKHQDFARRLGAEWVGDVAVDPPQKLDAAIIFAPVGELVPSALKQLDKGGRLVINAIHMTPIPQFEYRNLWQERSIKSVANITRQDTYEFLDLAAKIPLKVTTKEYSLESANSALLHLKQGLLEGSAVFKI